MRRTPLIGLVMLCVFSALAIAACQRGETAAEFFPLAAGMQWQYRIERKTMDGVQQLRYAITNVAPAPVDGAHLAARETVDGQRYYYRIEDGDIYRIGTRRRHGPRTVDDSERQMVLPGTLTPDAEWRAKSHTAVLESSGPPWETLFRITVPVDMAYRVESTSATVDTPAGSFSDCVLVAGQGRTTTEIGNLSGSTDIEITSREWYAPRVGLVRMERSERTSQAALDAGTLTMELDRWHRN